MFIIILDAEPQRKLKLKRSSDFGGEKVINKDQNMFGTRVSCYYVLVWRVFAPYQLKSDFFYLLCINREHPFRHVGGKQVDTR